MLAPRRVEEPHARRRPRAARAQTLAFPSAASPPAGDVPVQIQRTVRRERYRDGTPTPGGLPFEIAAGEFSVVEQYRRAIEAARSTIYVEDQAIASVEVVDGLHEALSRGVDVVFLVPVDPHPDMASARLIGTSQAFFDSLAALGKHEHFLLAGAGRAASRPAASALPTSWLPALPRAPERGEAPRGVVRRADGARDAAERVWPAQLPA